MTTPKSTRKITWRRAKKARMNGLREVRVASTINIVPSGTLFVYQNNPSSGVNSSYVYNAETDTFSEGPAVRSYADIADAPIEFMRLYGANGEPVDITFRGRKSDSLTTNEELGVTMHPLILKQLNNRVFVHNHPNALSFSPDDWALFDLPMIGMEARANPRVFWQNAQQIAANRDSLQRTLLKERSSSYVYSPLQQQAIDAAIAFVRDMPLTNRNTPVRFQLNLNNIRVNRNKSQKISSELDGLTLSLVGIIDKWQQSSRTPVPDEFAFIIATHAANAALAQKYKYTYSVAGIND